MRRLGRSGRGAAGGCVESKAAARVHDALAPSGDHAGNVEHSEDQSYPVKPQRIVSDLRRVLGAEDIAISDVGAHKMWMARMYQAERPNTCIISNGFASMGIAVPGAIAAKLAFPDRKVVAVSGDAAFMMNSQEIETALRTGTPFVILIWNDSEYGQIGRAH